MKLTELLEELDGIVERGNVPEEAAGLVLYDALCRLSGRGVPYGASDLSCFDSNDCVRGNDLYDLKWPRFAWIGLDEGETGFQTREWRLFLDGEENNPPAITAELAKKTGLSEASVRRLARRIERGEYKGTDAVVTALSEVRPDFFFSCRGTEYAEENKKYLATCFLRCRGSRDACCGESVWRCLCVESRAADLWLRFLRDHEVSPRDRDASRRVFSLLLSEAVSYSKRGMGIQTKAPLSEDLFSRPWKGASLPRFQICVMESLQSFVEFEEGLFLFGIPSFRFLAALLRARDFLSKAEKKYHFMERGI